MRARTSRLNLSMAAIPEGFPHHFLGGSERLGNDGVFFRQAHDDCAGAAIKMVLDFFKIPIEYGQIRQRLNPGPEGVTMLDLKRFVETKGLRCEGWRLSFQDLPQIPLPAVLLLRRNHFVVLERCTPVDGIILLDPVQGRLRLRSQNLLSVWKGETLLFCLEADEARYGRWLAVHYDIMKEKMAKPLLRRTRKNGPIITGEKGGAA